MITPWTVAEVRERRRAGIAAVAAAITAGRPFRLRRGTLEIVAVATADHHAPERKRVTFTSGGEPWGHVIAWTVEELAVAVWESLGAPVEAP